MTTIASAALATQIKGEEKAVITVQITEETFNGSVDIIPEFPWHVAVLRLTGEELIFLCSGTTVVSEFIVTAAKCVVPVPTEDLRVLISQANLHKLPFQTMKNQNEMFKVTNKYYKYHPDGLVSEKDLSVLRLQGLGPLRSTQLESSSFFPKNLFSKHCFTLGWGLHFKMNPSEKSCLRLRIQDIINNFPSVFKEQNGISLSKALNLRNMLGLCSTFLLKIGQMFNFPSVTYQQSFKASVSQEGTCPADEVAYRKQVLVSVKHHYKCLCPDESQLCLFSWQTDYLTKQVDIGSPVFCKIKRGNLQNGVSRTLVSQYVLSGIITNTDLGKIAILKLKHNSSANFMKASTSSLASYTKLLLALIGTEN